MQLYDRPGPAPEILSGWSLRLNVTTDGKGYDLILEDMTDKSCGYALVTDERGIIRQSKTIDCALYWPRSSQSSRAPEAAKPTDARWSRWPPGHRANLVQYQKMNLTAGSGIRDGPGQPFVGFLPS